jgi:hypothetical protein
MKRFLLPAGMALGLGALAFSPANAAPIATHGVVLAPTVTSDVGCRTVKKIMTRNGVRRVTTTRICDRDRYSRNRYVERRRVYRHGPRYERRHYRSEPGLSIGIGVR